VPGSRIGIEIWLPLQWNGKLLTVGNHGFAGEYQRGYLAMGLHRGYAVAATNTGHSGPFLNLGGLSVGSAAFAHGNPVAFEDFSWRAIHTLTVAAKELVMRAYGQPARRAYFAGCSNGGRQAMREAQMFPNDYDGILAGGAAMNWTGISAMQMRGALLGDLGNGRKISSTKLQLAERAAIAACDGRDGLRDGFIANPGQCRWQPRKLQCQPGKNGPDCLTPAEAAAIAGMMAPLRDPETRKELYPGFAPGSESIWATAIGSMSEPSPIMIDYYRYFVFNDAAWLPKDVKIIDLLRESERPGVPSLSLNATNPDLSAFKAAGGKLILYHGWRDEAMPPAYATQYYDEVVSRQPGRDKLSSTQDFFRLFMVPGLNHCYGGVGPVNFGGLAQEPSRVVDADNDILEALDIWVENGVAPKKIIATTYSSSNTPQRQMPLCPYPQTAVYVGGDPDRAGSFSCRPLSAARRRP